MLGIKGVLEARTPLDPGAGALPCLLSLVSAMNLLFISFRFLKKPIPGRLVGSTLFMSGTVLLVLLLVALHLRRGMSAVRLRLISVSLQACAVPLICTVWLRVGSCGVILGTAGSRAFSAALLTRASPRRGAVVGAPSIWPEVWCRNAGRKRVNGLQLEVAARAVLLVLRLVVQVVDGRRRCVHRIGVSLMPLEYGCVLDEDDASAEVTPTAFEWARELAAPAWVVLLLFADALAFMPVEVVLEMASTLPTPVVATLLT